MEIEAFAARSAEPVEFRWVVLPNGEVKGGKKGTRTTDLTDPMVD